MKKSLLLLSLLVLSACTPSQLVQKGVAEFDATGKEIPGSIFDDWANAEGDELSAKCWDKERLEASLDAGDEVLPLELESVESLRNSWLSQELKSNCRDLIEAEMDKKFGKTTQ